MVVAIDGPGGAGKSTVAAKTAEVLGLPHLDTGATYRAATVAALRGADPYDAAAVLAAVSGVPIRFEAGQVWLDGDDITSEQAGSGGGGGGEPGLRPPGGPADHRRAAAGVGGRAWR